jgi:predicted nuclease of predicted toxin-antitoxin system
MKVLIDVCVSSAVSKALQAAGHDVVEIAAIDRLLPDASIIRIACRDQRIIVTLDKDFGELAVLHKMPHSGIIRLKELPVQKHAQLCLEALTHYGERLLQGGIVTVDSAKERYRPYDMELLD